MVDFIADYLTNIRSRRVFPNVKPGYMRPMIDDEAPHQGESWEKIFNDIERVIMPGVRRQVSFRNSEKTENIFKVTHWQSPYMHAYFPALNSYPSMLGVNFSIDVRTEEWKYFLHLGHVGQRSQSTRFHLGRSLFVFSHFKKTDDFQASSPACTELETVVMDWLAKMIGLPNDFLHSHADTTGGGVIQVNEKKNIFRLWNRFLLLDNGVWSHFSGVARRSKRSYSTRSISISLFESGRNKRSFGRVLFGSGAFVGRKSVFDRFGQVEFSSERWKTAFARQRSSTSHRQRQRKRFNSVLCRFFFRFFSFIRKILESKEKNGFPFASLSALRDFGNDRRLRFWQFGWTRRRL